jgi:hypothetical protein
VVDLKNTPGGQRHFCQAPLVFQICHILSSSVFASATKPQLRMRLGVGYGERHGFCGVNVMIRYGSQRDRQLVMARR